MSRSAHERDLEISFEQDLARGLSHAEVRRHQEMLESSECPAWLADFLAQGRDRWSIYDGYALLVLLRWWVGGFISFASARVGVGPAADKMVDENNARLARLPSGFEAEFVPMIGSSYCDDGAFEWVKPLALEVFVDGAVRIYEHEPWSLPLEVGRTLASRTLLHIEQSGGVARWPYGSRHITVCRTTKAGIDAFAPKVPEFVTRALLGEACADLGLVGRT